MLLDEFLRCYDRELRKSEFHPADMADVPRDDMACAACYGKLDKMIVRLIAQVWPPAEVNAGPFAMRQEDVKKLVPLAR